MRVGWLTNGMLLLAATTAYAIVPVELELATKPGLQITAPQEWLQLFASAGIDNVRIHGATGSERPHIENTGTGEQPRYRVIGLLSARGELVLPGHTFRRSDIARLKEYLQQVAVDGPEAITAPRGRFGLTEKEFAAVFADLAQSIDFPTKGQPPRALVERLAKRLSVTIAVEASSDRVLDAAKPLPDEVQGLTAGTGLAIILRSHGLVLRPEKSVGQPVKLRITAADQDADSWPVGWEPDKPPVELAPALFEFINVEIDGYTLRETLEAIGPRIKVPYYWDHATLAAQGIDADTVKVAISRTRTFYKRVLDRALAQARLGAQLRVDEAGTAFLWITR